MYFLPLPNVGHAPFKTVDWFRMRPAPGKDEVAMHGMLRNPPDSAGSAGWPLDAANPAIRFPYHVTEAASASGPLFPNANPTLPNPAPISDTWDALSRFSPQFFAINTIFRG